jgi:hypothetical protein
MPYRSHGTLLYFNKKLKTIINFTCFLSILIDFREIPMDFYPKFSISIQKYAIKYPKIIDFY